MCNSYPILTAGSFLLVRCDTVGSVVSLSGFSSSLSICDVKVLTANAGGAVVNPVQCPGGDSAVVIQGHCAKFFAEVRYYHNSKLLLAVAQR